MQNIPEVSFELFPPYDKISHEKFWGVVARLALLEPKFFSVTYGAGGSTHANSDGIVRRFQKELPGTVAAHLTCVGTSQKDVDDLAKSWWEIGVRHIVALRGDTPISTSGYVPHPNGYNNAAALVSGILRAHEFEVSVAGYPEKHPDSADLVEDLENLKRKVDAGANRIITQYFFDNEVYLRFRDRTVRAGIEVPIVPGILPVTNFKKILAFSVRCGASVPPWMLELFNGLEEDQETRTLVAATTALNQCDQLRKEGVNAFHFYTLNRASLSYAICWNLGLRPKLQAAA